MCHYELFASKLRGFESPNFDFGEVDFDTMKRIFCTETVENLMPQGFGNIEKERKLQYQWYHNFRSYLVRVTGLDGLCPSFATRTPDCVRLSRGQVQVLLSFS